MSPVMHAEFTLSSTVPYWDVDRDQLLTLGGVFKFLQEAAVKHADLFDLGAKTMTEHRESWVLNRVAVELLRYPRYEETVTVRTWSTGIRGFRGYRDLRLYCGDELVLKASTLWLYVSLRTKSLTRVPVHLAEQFPVGRAEVFRPDLEQVRHVAPGAAAPCAEVSLRYADFDGNAHLNNTAYFDLLQTALSRLGQPVRPRALEVQFLKEVALSAGAIAVAVERDGDAARLAWRCGGELNAQGRAQF